MLSSSEKPCALACLQGICLTCLMTAQSKAPVLHEGDVVFVACLQCTDTCSSQRIQQNVLTFAMCLSVQAVS